MIRTVGVIVVVAIVTLACGDTAGSKAETDQAPVPASPSATTQLLAELEAAIARWRLREPSAYRLVVSQQCFCTPATPFVSVVRRGVVVSTAGGATNPRERELEPRLETVDMVFAEAERLIRKADGVTLEFDQTFGYPARIYVDWTAEAIDDEVTWLVALTRLE